MARSNNLLLAHLVGLGDDESPAGAEGKTQWPATNISPIFDLKLLVLESNSPYPAIRATSVKISFLCVESQVLRPRQKTVADAVAGLEHKVMALRHGYRIGERVVAG